jgi:hypothetical protein
MRRNSGRLLLPGLFLVLSGLAMTVPAEAQVPTVKIPGPAIKPTIRPVVPVVKECRDPSADSLTFQILSHDKAHKTRGRIRVTGVVKNIGNAAFESDPRQAQALLSEIPAEGGAGTIKAQRAIASLAPGASFTLRFERDWDTAREFPPKFTLLVTYDPDIYMDANKKNDDCNQNNNRRELTGEQINRTWR